MSVKQLAVRHSAAAAATLLGSQLSSATTVNNNNSLRVVVTSHCRNYAAQAYKACPVTSPTTLKPFAEIPGPKGLPVVGTLWDFVKPNGFKFNKMFEVQHERSMKYGPIYREKIGYFESVVIADLDEYAKVISADGRIPNRLELEPFVHYRNKKGLGLATVNAQGEEWYKNRKILSPKMLVPAEIIGYIEPLDNIASDLLTRLHCAQAKTADGVIHDMEHEMFKWALESIGWFLFEERIGCFTDPPSKESEAFIENLLGFFKYMQILMYGLPTYRLYENKTWRTYEQYTDKVISLGQSYVNKKVDALQKQAESGVRIGEKEERSAFLTYLLSQTTMTPKEVNSNCVDLMMGAVETTSNSLMWTLYCLAKNPAVQEAVYQETVSVLPVNTAVTADSLQKLHHIKACLKETFRLFPLIYTTSRRITKDIELFGYLIPAGTHCQANLYSIGRDEQLFPDVLRYKPERWLRESYPDGRLKSLASLVFGHGPRMCLGRRFAEQEIYILLTKIIQNFRLEYHAEDVKPVLHTVLTADRPFKLTFIPRS